MVSERPSVATVASSTTTEAGRVSRTQAAAALAAVDESTKVSADEQRCLSLRLPVDGAAARAVLAGGVQGRAGVVSVVRACRRVLRLAVRLGGGGAARGGCVAAALAGVSEAEVREFEALLVSPSRGDPLKSTAGKAVQSCR